ncbi:nucleoside hydrolase [Metabacillus iocasae]|uniref:Purine nucleosidase n=1 Tax=Priestia iocasae TaxID=2291674 RepID=A0ABS2QTM3_9BACI|nr:nucleoside hydrolase [Metabacillus iocasae]MBM7702794.1 purine nucleosidase [Metabacillus iocasae]
MTKKVLLFCDPGIDDAIAIMYALLNPDIELVGVVTSFGNVTKEQATRNAAYLLQIAGKSDIPIIPGAAQPIQQENMVYYPQIHGDDGIGPIEPPEDLIYHVYPFDTIRVLIEHYKDELIIVDVGRSTSLASAFILFNEQIKKVGAFYLMGGSFFRPGNVTPIAEANFHGDPTASNFILKFAHNLTISPLNVTSDAYLTPEVIDEISQTVKNPYYLMVRPIFQYYFHAYKKLAPDIVGAPIHDIVPLIMMINPSVADYLYYDVKVVEQGDAKGLSYADLRPNGVAGQTRIGMKLNYDIFLEEVKKVMEMRYAENRGCSSENN